MTNQHTIVSPNFRSPSARRGLTLTEVLISMGILAVGLLGAAAMFPVGSYFMQKGEIADRGAAIAQASFADLVARNELQPNKWQIWDAANREYVPMGWAMRTWMADPKNQPLNLGIAASQKNMNAQFGFVYLLDPLGTAEGVRAKLNRSQLSMAPYNSDIAARPEATTMDDNGKWFPFADAWPVRRLSSVTTNLAGIPSPPIADRLFTSSDDINFSVGEDDKPSQLRVIGPDSNGTGIPTQAVRRESRGDYSWMVSIAPSQNEARAALAMDPSAYYYDVSVIVFFKRAASLLQTSERLVRGQVLSTGTGGGEILLTKTNDQDSDPFAELKQGQWVMVSGPHPSSTDAKPVFFTQWYRVLAIDDQQRGPIQDADMQRIVGLRGPDWPWSPLESASVRVGLFPGAVAVHTKTMRLESLGPFSAK